MVQAPKDHVVITTHEFMHDKLGWQVLTHAYGPYTKNEALRMTSRLKSMYTFACTRKLLDRNEVTAKPYTPRG